MDTKVYGTSQEYAAALQRVIAEGVSPKQLDLLRHHFAAGRSGASMAELATKVGYANFGGVNMQYGALAKRVGIHLGLVEPPGFWVWVLAKWANSAHPETGHTRFVMRKEVREAVEILGLSWNK